MREAGREKLLRLQVFNRRQRAGQADFHGAAAGIVADIRVAAGEDPTDKSIQHAPAIIRANNHQTHSLRRTR